MGKIPKGTFVTGVREDMVIHGSLFLEWTPIGVFLFSCNVRGRTAT